MEDEHRRAYALVGELVLLASALDYQLNHVLIAMLGLEPSPMLEPVVASLDSNRKIAILKQFAGTIKAKQWTDALKLHLNKVDDVNRVRNLAAHNLLTFEDGVHGLWSPAATKLLASIDFMKRAPKKIPLARVEEAVRKGEVALGSGQNLIENLARVNAERQRRKGLPD